MIQLYRTIYFIIISIFHSKKMQCKNVEKDSERVPVQFSNSVMEI